MCNPPGPRDPLYDGNSADKKFNQEMRDARRVHWFDDRKIADVQTRNPHTQLPELEKRDYTKDPSTVVLEDFNGLSYDQAWQNISGADQDIAPGMTAQWEAISSAIVSALQDFRLDLAALEGKEDRWVGVTHDAAMANLEASFVEPQTAATGAGAMSVVVDAFSRTITTTRENIVNNRENYKSDLSHFPEHKDQIEREYATFAQKVMREAYAPNIVDIAKNHPAFTSNAQLGVGQPPPLSTPKTDGTGGSSPKLGGGGVGGGGVPSWRPPPTNLNGSPSAGLPNGPSNPASPRAPGASSGAGSGPGALGNAAREAAGSAANAAKQAMGEAGKTAPMSAGRPPEGVLGLGPKGIGDMPEKNGGAGGGAPGGVGAGMGPKDLAPLKGAGPLTAAGRAAGVAAGIAQAGMGAAGAGAPGMGAPPPSGGQQGGGGEKDHKVNKALRRRKNGELLLGDTPAIVPVVGEPGDAAAAKSEAP